MTIKRDGKEYLFTDRWIEVRRKPPTLVLLPPKEQPK